MKYLLAKPWILALIILGLVVGGFLIVNKIADTISSTKVSIADSNYARQHAIDSTNNVWHSRIAKISDSIAVEAHKKVESLLVTTEYYKNMTQLLNRSMTIQLQRYRANPSLVTCDSVVNSQITALAVRDSTINIQDSTIKVCRIESSNLRIEVNSKEAIHINDLKDLASIKTDFTVYKTQAIKKEKRSNFALGVSKVVIIIETTILILKSI